VPQVGRPQIEPVRRQIAVNTIPTSAEAPPSTHHPSLRRRSHIAAATVVIPQAVKATIAVGTWM
jgi:hypothetical protein